MSFRLTLSTICIRGTLRHDWHDWIKAMDLIDRIYEASMVPDHWPAVYDAIGEAVDCDKLGMFMLSAARQSVVGWIGNARIQEAITAFAAGGWAARSSQASRMLSRGEPRFVSDLDVFTQEELNTDPYYQEFLKPHGLFWGAGTFIDGPTDNKIIVTIHRPYEMGPLSRKSVNLLDGLRPHLARSAFLTSQLRLERLRGAVTALDMVGLPAAALSENGRLLLANQLFQADVPTVFLDKTDRLHLHDLSVDRRLGFLLANHGPLKGGSLVLKQEDGKARSILHLLPMSGQARDLFSGAGWLIVAPPVNPVTAPAPGLLEGLFDLTPAEARLARALMDGNTLVEIARANKLSHETLRSQLKSVFRKTSVSKQVDLVKLVLAATPRRSD